MIPTLKSEAHRKTMALLLALTTALGPTAMPAFANSKPTAPQTGRTAPRYRDAHPAPSGDFPGECFLRSLFWNLSSGNESEGRA
jgi:hypothetical protein